MNCDAMCMDVNNVSISSAILPWGYQEPQEDSVTIYRIDTDSFIKLHSLAILIMKYRV